MATSSNGSLPAKFVIATPSVAAPLACCVLLLAPVSAQAGTGATLQAMRQEISQMRANYEARISALEARIEELERTSATSLAGATAPRQGADSAVAAIRAAARRAAGAQAPLSTDAAAPDLAMKAAAMGHERNLSRLNPEISFTGDLLARYDSPAAAFDAREFEIDMQSALDPFSSAKLTLSFGSDEAEVEEGYLRYHGLARGLSLRAGKMRQSFGVLNRYHQHALPVPDYPLPLQFFFGAEGLAQTGLSIEWLLPWSWSSANEVTVQLMDSSAEPFGAGGFRRLTALAHLQNYWDIDDASYFEWGLSAVGGRSAPGRESKVFGTDLSYHWQPPGRAKYHEITWRTEALLSMRDDESGNRRDAWGLYSYVESLLRRNLYLGLFYDRAADPRSPGDEQWRISPYLTWWQSEYVRLRGAYEFYRNATGRNDHRVLAQFTWAAGPHKHENY